MLTNKYEISPEEINKEWGVEVGPQRNLSIGLTSTSGLDGNGEGNGDGNHRMSDEEYYKRYGRHRDSINFLSEVH